MSSTMEGFGHWIIIAAVGLDAFAAVVYLMAGDVPRSVYWIGAGVATAMTVYIT